MRAVVIDGGALRWEAREDPVPGDHDLLVEVRAAGVNNADLIQRDGFYPAPPGSPPDIPGLELAGEVVQAGPRATRFRPGDRVMAVVGGGAQATLAIVDEAHALPVPDGIPWEEAGGFPEVFSTAHDALFTRGGLTLGDRLLVTGAAGGVGTAAVQLGAATGAVVVASVRDPAKRDGVRALGADHVIDPSAVEGHGPYDVVLELVGAESLATALGNLGTGGRVVVIGVGGTGSHLHLNLSLLMGKRASISGATLRARDRTEKAGVARAVADHVLPLWAEGRIRVPVTDTFPLPRAADAYARFAAGGKLGKIVLVV